MNREELKKLFDLGKADIKEDFKNEIRKVRGHPLGRVCIEIARAKIERRQTTVMDLLDAAMDDSWVEEPSAPPTSQKSPPKNTQTGIK